MHKNYKKFKKLKLKRHNNHKIFHKTYLKLIVQSQHQKKKQLQNQKQKQLKLVIMNMNKFYNKMNALINL